MKIDILIRIAREHFNITEEEFYGRRRLENQILARGVVSKMLKSNGYTLDRIAKVIAPEKKYNHATIINKILKITELVDSDETVRNKYESIYNEYLKEAKYINEQEIENIYKAVVLRCYDGFTTKGIAIECIKETIKRIHEKNEQQRNTAEPVGGEDALC